MSGSPDAFPDRGPAVFAVTSATLCLATVFVIARLVCRLGIVHRIGWDDYFIIVAWLLAFGLSFTINYGTHKGLGLHDANILPEDRNSLRRSEYAFSILYNPSLMATKTSILIFYLRLSRNTQPLLRLGSYAVLVVVNTAGIVLTFLNIFQCRPVAAAFSDMPGRCIPLLTEFICSAPVNIITDLAILALPIPILTGMRLPSRQKTILVLTFALGIFVTVVDVVRIYYLQQAINVVQTGSSSDPNSIFGDSVDFSWNASLSLMWSSVEVNVGITCACIPTLKPLIIKILPAMLMDPDGSSSVYSSGVRDPDVSDAASRPGIQRHRTTSSRLFGLISSPSSPRTMSISGADTGPDTAATPSGATNGDTSPPRPAQATSHVTGAGATAPAPATVSNTDLDLGPRSHLDADFGRDTNLALNRISAADHAQISSTPPSPTDSRHHHDNMPSPRQVAATSGPASSARPSTPPAGHSTLARVASNTRDALAAVSDIFQAPRAGSTSSRPGQKDTSVYFGFVNMKRPKSMLDATVSESFKYCTIVAVLFFLWGFSYGLLNTLNNVVAAVANMTTAQTLGLTSAYFGGGYFFGPLLVGGWVLRHDEHHRRKSASGHDGHMHREGRTGTLASIPVTAATVASAAASVVTRRSHSVSSEDSIGGFKATFMVGLCFYGVGTIMFWPSSVLTSFPGFLISSFVVGFGLSILESSANPFLVLCGPMEYAEMRILLAQATQGVGSVLSGLLAQNVFFVNVSATDNTNSTTLLDVQWTYLAITLFCVALAMFFYYMPLPEVHDAELEAAASRLPVDGTKRSFAGLQLRTVCLMLAVFAQWTYVASQESMSVYFHHIVTSWLPGQGTPGAGGLDGFAFTIPAIANVINEATSSITPSENANQPPGLIVSVSNYLLVCRTAFTVSRFCTAGIVYLGVKHPGSRWLPAPRTILATSPLLMALFALLAVALPPSTRNPNLIVVPVTLFFLAEGPVWPLIFALGLRGQGARTKKAAAYITMGASGPLFWPFVMYAILARGGSIRTAFVIVVVLMFACSVYPLFLTFVRDARELTKVAPLNPPAETGPGGGGRGASDAALEAGEAAATGDGGPADEEKNGVAPEQAAAAMSIPILEPSSRQEPIGDAPASEETPVAAAAAAEATLSEIPVQEPAMGSHFKEEAAL